MKTDENKREETLPVVVCDQTEDPVENRILTIRGVQVILDVDIAKVYGIKTKRLNEQVQRNISRFPSDFMFQLSQEEFDYLRSQNATANWRKRRTLPFSFTELGVSMLSSVLTSEVAIQANIRIMRAFVSMRSFLVANAQVFQRLENLEYKQIATDQKERAGFRLQYIQNKSAQD